MENLIEFFLIITLTILFLHFINKFQNSHEANDAKPCKKKTTTTNNQKVNKNVLLLSKEEIEGLTYDLRAMPIELYEDEITNLKLIAAQSQDLIGSRLYFGEDGYYYQGLKAKEYSFTKPIKIFSETSMESFTKKVSGTKVILSDYNEYKEWKKRKQKTKTIFLSL